MPKAVLPTILNADEVIKIPDEVLILMTRISTGIVVENINKFISMNKGSSDSIDREAALKLERVYAEVNEVKTYLESDEAKNLASTLASLQYSDVSATTDIETLKTYRMLIIDLLSEDEDFVKTYTTEQLKLETSGKKTAYTAKLDKGNLEDVISLMESKAGGIPEVYALIGRIRKNKSLFKNGNYNVNSPTVLRKAIYKKDKLKNILRGLDFLIPKLESGQNPITWRRL